MLNRSPLAAAALVLATGCSGFRSMFPTHEQVYTPVEATVGEARVAGAETTYVVSAPGYELVGPTRDVLPRVKSALDLAAGRYRRYFAADPPTVVVELRRTARETKGVRPESTWVRADGARAVSLTPLQPTGGRRYDGAAPVFVSVQAVAHLWLSALADATAGRADSAGRVLAARTRDDPRIPDWIEDALIELIAPSARQDLYAGQLARQSGDLLPLRTLFEAARPVRAGGARGDTAGAPGVEAPGQPVRPPETGGRGSGRVDLPPRAAEPGRNAPRLGPSTRFAAQSLAVAQWIAEREGPPFLGQLATRLIAGERVAVALAGVSTVAADLDRLDAEWRAWLARQGGDAGARRSRGGN